ncbi:hypothetical protein [Cytobacillus praedii]|uniref:hypothetical protein n=1 Tax=Cytobacillus praedii TaxID=1742358 RepID=UPI002E1EE86D|nr:hypothetical protein [Cytobacillus praedii]
MGSRSTISGRLRVIAENAPTGYTEQHHAGFDIIEVDVVGRLYDFHVTDILDFIWANVIEQQKD